MLRRYAPIAKSSGTRIPDALREFVMYRDRMCVGRVVGFPTECFGQLELDHVRASGGMGMKSRTSDDNLVALCSVCHRWKTLNGRQARPLLLAYLEGEIDHSAHVDPCGPTCRRRTA